MDESELMALPTVITQAYHQGGWLLVASIALNRGIQFLRSDVVQQTLPPKLRWDALSAWQRWALVIGCSYVGGMLHALAGGISWWQAAWGGAVAALGAMGLRKTQKALTKPSDTEYPPLPDALPPVQPRNLERVPPED